MKSKPEKAVKDLKERQKNRPKARGKQRLNPYDMAAEASRIIDEMNKHRSKAEVPRKRRAVFLSAIISAAVTSVAAAVILAVVLIK